MRLRTHVAMNRNTSRRDRHRRTIARDHPDCHICGEPIDYRADHLDPLSFTIDHIIPLNRGGEDVIENIGAAHRKCNRDKSDTLPKDEGVTFVTTRHW